MSVDKNRSHVDCIPFKELFLKNYFQLMCKYFTNINLTSFIVIVINKGLYTLTHCFETNF